MFFIFLCFPFTLLRGCIDCIYFFLAILHPLPSALPLSPKFVALLAFLLSVYLSSSSRFLFCRFCPYHHYHYHHHHHFYFAGYHRLPTTGHTLLYFSSYFYFSLSIFHPPHFSFNISSIRRSPLVPCSTLHCRPKWGRQKGKSDADKPGINRSPVAMRYECVLEEKERGVLLLLLLLLEQKGKGTTSTTTTTTLERLMKILLPKVSAATQ